MYEELKPRLPSRYPFDKEREGREGREERDDGWPGDDNEYEPIQSPVCSGLAQHDNIFNLKLLPA